MSDKRETANWLVLLGITICADLLLFPMIEAQVQRLVVSRLLSLVTAYGIAQIIRLVSGFGKPPSALFERPGLWPLVVITTVLNTALLVFLNDRAPLVQLAVHLALAWLGSLVFLGFGLRRIRRFNSPD